ncbi:MAG: F0F1 ATP synthase subunit gamma [Aeriscardovia sp.]|nr:F0F1 ATP synthase subunit gamma [Aeriscardovia sp.]
MASQLALKGRIASTRSLSKVFQAQEMIASAHIARAKAAALSSKPYAEAVYAAARKLVSHVKDVDHPIFKRDEANPKSAVFLVSADRGMAGAYNSNAIRKGEELMGELEKRGKEPLLFTFGKRAEMYFSPRRKVEKSWGGHSDNPSPDQAEKIAQALLPLFLDGGAGELYLVYTEFLNLVSQKVKVLRLLPIELIKADSSAPEPLYEFEPDPEDALDALLPRYIASRIFECLLSSAASETASRQNAMHAATENAKSLIKDLTVSLNKARQAQITQELTEIISSADALKKKK